MGIPLSGHCRPVRKVGGAARLEHDRADLVPVCGGGNARRLCRTNRRARRRSRGGMTAIFAPSISKPRRILVIAGWAGLGLVALIATMSDFIARAPVNELHAGPILAPPSVQFPFGTDLVGRDLLSETLHALSIT